MTTILHIRNIKDNKIDNRGGATFAVYKRGPNDFLLGWAVCSKKDNFNKRVGREIATARARSESAIPLVVEEDANPNTIYGRTLIIRAMRNYIEAANLC